MNFPTLQSQLKDKLGTALPKMYSELLFSEIIIDIMEKRWNLVTLACEKLECELSCETLGGAYTMHRNVYITTTKSFPVQEHFVRLVSHEIYFGDADLEKMWCSADVI